MSGAEFQRAKEEAAAIMRAKQEAGMSSPCLYLGFCPYSCS